MTKRTANIFVLIDGLGWEWVKAAPFLNEVTPHRRCLDTVFGFSAGAIPSILTGRHPQEHGRMAMFQRAVDGRSPFARLKWICSMPPVLVENRCVRRVVKSAAAMLGRFTGYFNIYSVPLRYLPLLDVAEKRDIYRPGGIPGSTSIFDLLQANGRAWRSYSYHPGRRLLAHRSRATGTRSRHGRLLFSLPLPGRCVPACPCRPRAAGGRPSD
jgi:hypothetical protein